MEIVKKDYRQISGFVDCSFELTSLCNFKCIHCYNADNKRNDLTFDEISIILHRIKEFGVIELLLTGGEIFLRPDISKIIDLCYELGFRTTLYSNGSLITNDLAKKISTYNMNVEITIYGSCEDTYRKITGSKTNYQKAIGGLYLLRLHNAKVKTKSIILNQNYSDLKDICILMSKFNNETDVYSEISCFLFGDKEKMKKYRLDILKSKRILEKYNHCRTNSSKYGFCTALKNQFSIDNQGNINPCLGWRSVIVGNILEDDWKTKILKFAKHFRKELQNTSIKCNKCELFVYCIVCPMTFYQDTGYHFKYSEESCKFAKIRKEIYDSRTNHI
uniref:Radical SAM additional 4Fe4S-binding SPASM domain-containing protein n=1 Tax=Eubacterium plexicaudatum ASF492 TaxID=1235802 RepID=N2A9X0_9FIRM